MRNKPNYSLRREIEEFALTQLPAHAPKTVVVNDGRITHNAADFFHSLATLDKQLAEIEYNRDGVEIPSVAEWAAIEIEAGSPESLISAIEGLPQTYRAGLLKTWRKFSE